MTSERGTEAYGPRWRALLEARWQARLRELTELSLAYHVAIAALDDHIGQTRRERRSLRHRQQMTLTSQASDFEQRRLVDDARYDFPHHLDDQAGYGGGRDGAGRGGPVAAR